jgi:uncharacterized membrane protein YozB (DUF420 family)
MQTEADTTTRALYLEQKTTPCRLPAPSEPVMLTGPTVILILKAAVLAVTLLLLASLVALIGGNTRLHGRINLAFFGLTVVTLLGFETVIRVIQPELFDYIQHNEDLNRRLMIHLCFAIPSALLMPLMLYTGLTHRRSIHVRLAVLFGVLWAGTFFTGVFTLPHTP